MMKKAMMKPMRATLAAAALAAACSSAPHLLEIDATYRYAGDDVVNGAAALVPVELVQQLGGLPDPWPPGAPRLDLDVPVEAAAPLDLRTASGGPLDLARAKTLRVLEVTAFADDDSLSPAPSTLELYVGPTGALHVADKGVVLVGRQGVPAAGQAGAFLLDVGGREALEAALRAQTFELLFRVIVPWDTAAHPARPSGTAAFRARLTLESLP